MQNWGPVREQERLPFVSLLQELGRAPLRDPKRMLLQNPERVPVRKQKRRLLRHEDRVQVRTQVQHPEQKPFRLDELVPMRCQVRGPERCLLLRPERLPFPALLRRQEPGPAKGQALAQLSGRRPRRRSD